MCSACYHKQLQAKVLQVSSDYFTELLSSSAVSHEKLLHKSQLLFPQLDATVFFVIDQFRSVSKVIFFNLQTLNFT